ncbi:MAG TPA: protoporphyrinogen oxidase, partial [Halothiobacillaceae bacterium]|nr:protoporphyrinogen oxidase [Halothiobacillaceae bacterium]
MNQQYHTHQSPFLVIGGGITGLSLALELARKGAAVTLVEAEARLGGNIHSVKEDGWQMEIGPNTLLAKLPLYRLIDSLGLADQVIFTPEASKKRYVVKGGELIALPDGLKSALKNPLINGKDWCKLFCEPFRRPARHEETLAEFIERRLGKNILDYFVDPFVSGVYAGDPQRLSAKAAMARIHNLEQEYGSLLRGGMAQLRKNRKKRAQEGDDGLPDNWRGKLVSFPDGIETLTQAMADELAQYPNARIFLATTIENIGKKSGLWLATDQHGNEFCADQLVLTTPAHRTAQMLARFDASIQSALDAIVYPPIAAVVLGYERKAVKHPLDGFGVLIPGKEKRQTLGALFSSTLFPDRAPENRALFTCFIGGRKNPGISEQTDAELIETVNSELSEILKISQPPVFKRIARWSHAIPQYEIGHLERIAAIDEYSKKHTGLHLMGNWRDGISV